MLTILDEDLCSFNCVQGIDPRTKLPSFKLTVATSNKLVHYAKPQNGKKQKNGVDMTSNPKLETTTREILSVTTPSDDVTGYRNLPISLRVGENARGVPTVNIRCLGENDANKANIYVIAFPFNGMIKPIPEDPKYHIYKGLIAASQRPFMYNGRRYRKILYLVVEPHMALFNADHKYHVNSIPIQIESYAIYKDKENDDEKTNHETYTLTIVGQDGMYTENWEYETLNEAVNIPASSETPVWHTFKFATSDTKPSGNKGGFRGQKSGKLKNGKREGYVQGDMYVTTNKHGIRKEVSINKGRGQKGSGDIDRMMKQSGMFEPKDDRRETYGRKKGNKGKKGRRQNQHDDY